jgi:sulfur-oxidizing protein SoxZ
MANIKPRIKLPKTAKVGEIVTIKTLIKHIMVSGQHRDENTGEKLPRMIIHTFEASFNGKRIITIYPQASVSQDPYFKFTMRVEEAGELHCKWIDDEGSVFEGTKSLAIA